MRTTTEDKQINSIKDWLASDAIIIVKTLIVTCSTIQIIIAIVFIAVIISLADVDAFIGSGLILFLLILVSGIIGIIISITQKKISLHISINRYCHFWLYRY